MGRLAKAIFAVIVLCISASKIDALPVGQTPVSVTVTDADGQAWANGSYQFIFKPSPINPNGPYFWTGGAFNPNTPVSGNFDATGSFSNIAVPDNNTITPVGSQWVFQACPAATAPCQQFTFTITGATTQNITPGVNPSGIRINLGNPLPGAAAYRDTEIVGAKPGAIYFNLTDNTLHFCSGSPSCSFLSINASVGVHVQTFLVNGTFTIPATSVKVRMVGGGGGGGSSNGAGTYGCGGSGGSYTESWLAGLTIGNTLSVSVGTFGAGATSGSGPGSAGGTTTVSSGSQVITSITAIGGAGGGGNSTANPNSCGTITSAGAGNGITIPGAAAPPVFSVNLGGNGASSAFGVGAVGITGSAGANAPTFSYGSGGAGAQGVAAAGGNGAMGFAMMEWVQ